MYNITDGEEYCHLVSDWTCKGRPDLDKYLSKTLTLRTDEHQRHSAHHVARNLSMSTKSLERMLWTRCMNQDMKNSEKTNIDA